MAARRVPAGGDRAVAAFPDTDTAGLAAAARAITASTGSTARTALTALGPQAAAALPALPAVLRLPAELDAAPDTVVGEPRDQALAAAVALSAVRAWDE